MATTETITGTVVGFVLILDPDNSENKYERIEFSDAVAMTAHADQIERDDAARFKESPSSSFIPTGQQFCTIYQRTDNGEMEPSEGYDPSGKIKVGDPGHKMFCLDCDAPMWFIGPPAAGRNYRCAECCEADNDDFLEDDSLVFRY